MSQLARISRAALRNPPSRCRFLNKHEKLVSSTTYVVGLPTDWLNKSNLWNVVVPAAFFNPNGINHRPPFFIPCSLFSTTSSNDHLHDKKVSREKVKIVRVLLDYDDPHNHLIDGVKVMSNVLKKWNKFRPNFEVDYVVGDLEIFRLSPYLKVDQKEISMAEQKILKLLMSYDDPEFADQVLLAAFLSWKGFTSSIKLTNDDKHEHDEEVNYLFPSSVVTNVRNYKMMTDNFDDRNAKLEEIDAQKKELEEIKAELEEIKAELKEMDGRGKEIDAQINKYAESTEMEMINLRSKFLGVFTLTTL